MIVSEVASPGTFSHSSPIDTKVNAIWLKLIEQILIDIESRNFWQIFWRLLKDIAYYCMILQSSMHLSSISSSRVACTAREVSACPRVSIAACGSARPTMWQHHGKTMHDSHDSNLWVQLRTAFSPKLLDCFDTFCKTPCFATDSFFGYLAVKRFPYLRFCPWIAEVYWKMASWPDV